MQVLTDGGVTVLTGAYLIAQAEPGAPVVVAPAREGAVVAEEGLAVAEEEGIFPPFDSSSYPSQLLWLAITFTALYLLMARVIIPRVGGILEDRRDRIASDLDMAERLKKQSDDAIAGYERALAEAKAGAFRLGQEAKARAKAEADARQAKVEAELDARLATAEARIGEIKAKALADVGEIAAEAAEAVVARLTGHAPGKAAVRAAVAAAGKRGGTVGNG